jgi:hydroxyacylglutathione hydrolase
MKIKEIADDLFFVERGFLNGNHFIYKSDKPTLIDSGYKAGLGDTLRILAELDINVSSIESIINTHCHCDHIGGNNYLQNKSKCSIGLHKIGKYFIDMRDSWSTWWRYYDQEADFFHCSKALDDGDVIHIGPHAFELIYTPGHSADGIVLFNRVHKFLISSDTLWERDAAVLTIRIEGSKAGFDLFNSIQKIEHLPVEKVYPGHGRAFTDFSGAIARAKKRLKSLIKDPQKIGQDVIKKIIIYTLMMHRQIPENRLLPQLMESYWYKETVDLYFEGHYEEKYNEVITDFLRRGIIKNHDKILSTTVAP